MCRRLRTFDGRVIFVDEVALDELDSQATLSDTATTDDYELVFPKELGGHGQPMPRVEGLRKRRTPAVAQGGVPMAMTGGRAVEEDAYF